MAINIGKHLAKDCDKGFVIAGSLHMNSEVDMPTGREKYTAIGDYAPLKGLSQSMIEVVDCKDLDDEEGNIEVKRQCESLLLSPTIKDVFASIYENEGYFVASSLAPKKSNIDGIGAVPSPLISERWVIK